MKIVCGKCNIQIEQEDIVNGKCPNCGNSIDSNGVYSFDNSSFQTDVNNNIYEDVSDESNNKGSYSEDGNIGQYVNPVFNSVATPPKKSKKWPFIVGIIGIILLFVVIHSISEGNHKNNDEIKVLYSASHYKNQYYKDVIEELEENGFTNISTEVERDILLGVLKSEGDVERVSIDGDSKFSKGKWFDCDADVVVVYHDYALDYDEEDESIQEKEELDNDEIVNNENNNDKDTESKSDVDKNNEEDKNNNEKKNSENVFDPQDVSDATIESIETYGDYLIMYQKILEDYFNNYEKLVKGTSLYDEESWEETKKDYEEGFEELEEEYRDMKYDLIVGKDYIIDYLKSFRDGLQEYIDSMEGVYDSLDSYEDLLDSYENLLDDYDF